MDMPKLTIVGTPDLPQGIREMFGDALCKAHERVESCGELIGYRVVHIQDGTVYLSNIILDDATGEWFEDDRDEAIEPPSSFVPCRRDYHVCPKCLLTIRAHAHAIEGESEEDRPHPATDDAWEQVRGSGLLCGGDHCDDPPQMVVWTKVDGTVEKRRSTSTGHAIVLIAGVVQWDPEVNRPPYEDRTPAETIELYERIGTHLSGTFVREDLDPITGQPKEAVS